MASSQNGTASETVKSDDVEKTPTFAEVVSGTKSNQSELEPFIVEEKEQVVDVGNMVYMIILLHGIGTLMPWNMFLTIANQYYADYKMVNFVGNTTEPTVFSRNYIMYQSICAQIPNLLLNFINIFVVIKGSLVRRITTALTVVFAVIVFTMIFIYVDTWSFLTTFFVVTMISIVILNAANGVYQNSIFGLAADFPFRYTNAVIIGNNACGTFVTILNIVTFALTDDVRLAAFAYFSISLVTLAVCFASFFKLRHLSFYKHHSEKAAAQREIAHTESGPVTKQDYLDALKQGWKQFLNVYLTFFVSLTCFPALMVDISANGAGEEYSSFIPEGQWRAVTTFLLFNVFAFVGSMLAGKFQKPGPKYLWIPVFARLLFIPLFAFCNFRVEERTWPVLFPSSVVFIVGGLVMSISSGYLSGLGMMYASKVVDATKQRIAGMMAAFFLIFGIVSGITFSILVAELIENYGPEARFVKI